MILYPPAGFKPAGGSFGSLTRVWVHFTAEAQRTQRFFM